MRHDREGEGRTRKSPWKSAEKARHIQDTSTNQHRRGGHQDDEAYLERMQRHAMNASESSESDEVSDSDGDAAGSQCPPTAIEHVTRQSTASSQDGQGVSQPRIIPDREMQSRDLPPQQLKGVLHKKERPGDKSKALTLSEMQSMCQGTEYETIYSMYVEVLAEMQNIRLNNRAQEEKFSTDTCALSSALSLASKVATSLANATAASSVLVGPASPHPIILDGSKGNPGATMVFLSAVVADVTKQLEMTSAGMAQANKFREGKEKAEQVVQKAMDACKSVAAERDAALATVGSLKRDLKRMEDAVVQAQEARDASREESKVCIERREMAEAEARKLKEALDVARTERDAAVSERERVRTIGSELRAERDAAIAAADVAVAEGAHATEESVKASAAAARAEGERDEANRQLAVSVKLAEAAFKERDDAVAEASRCKAAAEIASKERLEEAALAACAQEEAALKMDQALLRAQESQATADGATERMRAELEEAREAISDLERTAAGYREKFIAAVEERDAVQRDSAGLRDESERAKDEAFRCNASTATARAERDRAVAQAQAASLARDRLASEIGALKEEKKRMQAERDQASAEVATLSRKNSVRELSSCPSCGAELPMKSAGHASFIRMPVNAKSEQAILHLETRLAAEEPYIVSPRRRPEDFLADREQSKHQAGLQWGMSPTITAAEAPSSLRQASWGQPSAPPGRPTPRAGASPVISPAPAGLQAMHDETYTDDERTLGAEGSLLEEDFESSREWASHTAALASKHLASSSGDEASADSSKEYGTSPRHASHTERQVVKAGQVVKAPPTGVAKPQRQAGVGLMLMQDATPTGTFEVYVDGCQNPAAYEQGVKIGDVVRGVDGVDVSGQRAFEVRSKLIGAVDSEVIVTLQRNGLCLCGNPGSGCLCLGMFDVVLRRG